MRQRRPERHDDVGPGRFGQRRFGQRQRQHEARDRRQDRRGEVRPAGGRPHRFGQPRQRPRSAQADGPVVPDVDLPGLRPAVPGGRRRQRAADAGDVVRVLRRRQDAHVAPARRRGVPRRHAARRDGGEGEPPAGQDRGGQQGRQRARGHHGGERGSTRARGAVADQLRAIAAPGVDPALSRDQRAAIYQEAFQLIIDQHLYVPVTQLLSGWASSKAFAGLGAMPNQRRGTPDVTGIGMLAE